ncbi:DUF6923 family protein [Tahibacter harae]|uniref:DUF6923 domain-containing protein n=1 Tax=Tahibacter harae TaxID=2963937 RepID=A0ABT1QVA0_9GAMM|nr:hypothetical protein [Tahibacter harae]MCQ4166214.1 hypothetical protein [Tahibacter harae]
MHVLKLAGIILAGLTALPALAADDGTQDCAAWKNSLKREPEWYSQKCLGHAYGALSPKDAQAAAMPKNLGDTTYQFNMRSGGTGGDSLQSFLLPNANTATIIGPQTGNLYGLEYDNVAGRIYAVSDLLQFGELNKTTGVFTPSVTMTGFASGQSITGLAFQTPSSPYYISTSNGTDSQIYTLNPATGVATLVGNTGTPLMIDIAINASGQMYGHDIGTDSIYSINTATGAATLIGATGVAANFAQGIEFDKTTGVLYAWLYEGGGVNRFATIDLATGAATTVATPLAGEYEGATTPVSLQSFSVD